MTQKTIETRSWDATGHLGTEDDMADYLDTAMEDSDPAVIMAALGDITRIKGMSRIRAAGLGRESGS